MGRCSECGAWNSFQQFDETDYKSKKLLTESSGPIFEHIDEIDIKHAERIETPFKEFNRIAGGGIVKGSYSLLSGHPGIGSLS